jgi:hypothetical protein
MKDQPPRKVKSTQKPLTSFFFSKGKEIDDHASKPNIPSSQHLPASREKQQDDAAQARRSQRDPVTPETAGEVINIEDSPAASTTPRTSNAASHKASSPPEDSRPSKRAKLSDGPLDDNSETRTANRAPAGLAAAPPFSAGSSLGIPEHNEARHDRFQVGSKVKRFCQQAFLACHCYVSGTRGTKENPLWQYAVIDLKHGSS